MTAQVRSREALIAAIIELERRMFVAVKASSYSACQDHLQTFSAMRHMSHSVLSDETLESYLHDLREALDPACTLEGCCVTPNLSGVNELCPPALRRNFFTEKYARIEGKIPSLSTSPLIDEILEIETKWVKELRERFPNLLRSGEAFECYERAELETYSERTLGLFARDLRAARDEGRNLVEERYLHLCKQIGVSSLRELEACSQKVEKSNV